MTAAIILRGDYIYYRNKSGAHEPGYVIWIGARKAKIWSDGSAESDSGYKIVSLSRLELQEP